MPGRSDWDYSYETVQPAASERVNPEIQCRVRDCLRPRDPARADRYCQRHGSERDGVEYVAVVDESENCGESA